MKGHAQRRPSELKAQLQSIQHQQLLKDGFHLQGNCNLLYVVQYKDKRGIHFDVKVLTNTSFLFGAYMCRIQNNIEVSAAIQSSNQPSLNINMVHQLLGHHSKTWTQQIAKALGILIAQGSMDVCKACAIANAKQKNTQHKSQGQGKASAFNEKVYSDLSYIYGPDQKHAQMYVWHLMVDSATGLVTDRFYKTKIKFIDQHVSFSKNGNLMEMK